MQKFRNTSFITQKRLLAVKMKIVNIGGEVTQQQKDNCFLCKILFA